LTPKVLKFDGPSKDGRRHRRGTYLFLLIKYFFFFFFFRSVTYNSKTGDCALSDLDRRTATNSGSNGFIVS
jgi:hypothetical protein